MSDLGERLERLGLSQYLEILVAEGFDTWATVLDITESDLNTLGFKLGHRRKLQRAIAEYRGLPSDRGISLSHRKASSLDGSYRSDDSGAEGKQVKKNEPAAPTTAKRKYRRHPKPDEHAPERPPSAYVIFSNQMREALKSQELSFTEIAKVVGERWQVLPTEQREVCERQANEAKEKYYAELAEYKKTPEYAQYQAYLEDFKAKHAPPKTEGKRSKLETETSRSTRSSSHEIAEKVSQRRVSAGPMEGVFPTHHRSGSSPPPSSHSRSFAQAMPSKSTSPATYSYPGLNSPRNAERYSPMSASPRSTSALKDVTYELHSHPGSGMMQDHRERPYDASQPAQYAPFAPPHTTNSSTPPSVGYFSHYQSGIELPSRRSNREMSTLPSLTHEDTTLSSDSTHSAHNGIPYQGSLIPVVDAPKPFRLLPQPVPMLGATPSPLDQRPGPVPPPLITQNHEFRPRSSLAALLRAGELARDADNQGNEKDPP